MGLCRNISRYPSCLLTDTSGSATSQQSQWSQQRRGKRTLQWDVYSVSSRANSQLVAMPCTTHMTVALNPIFGRVCCVLFCV